MFKNFGIYGLLGIVLFLSSTAIGQTGATNGEVVDKTGAAVSGADITLRNKQTGQEVKTQTDESGSFRFEGLTPGDYLLKAEANGFSFTSRDVSIPGNS
ncbi:MAG: carboxypeptidase regulatory-like domain-containing protein, partial [Acidobacteria bacterium]|nr:carboxypeptidase regulatory-like domain-containing protein [Acidobacteriota bacterium]